MKKKILFRADGNESIGLGHLYRLLALVETYKKQYDFVFLTKENSTKSIIPKEYNLDSIPNDITIQQEPNWVCKKYPSKEFIIISDGYQFISSYQKKVKELGYKMIYIDDLASELMYADVVVNHSPRIKPEDFKTQDYTKLALGTKYALLRTEFLNQLSRIRPTIKQNNFFVCFGGSDSYRFSFKAVKSLLKQQQVDKIFVILGAENNDLDLIELEKNYSDKVFLYKNLQAKELLNIMLSSQFAIVSSSTILYELCCSNTVCLSGYYVNNQKRIHDGFLMNKAIYSLGNISKFEINDFTPKITQLLSSKDHSIQLENQKTMFDANIKSRFLNLIKELC